MQRSIAQLKEERAKLDKAIEALSGVVGGKSGGERSRRLPFRSRPKRIADTQRARSAKFKAKRKITS
jgi:hypothetical protein